MQTFQRGVGFGIRLLLKNSGVTLIAALTLSLGIAANTALLQVFYVRAREVQKKPELLDSLDSSCLAVLAREVKAENHTAPQQFVQFRDGNALTHGVELKKEK